MAPLRSELTGEFRPEHGRKEPQTWESVCPAVPSVYPSLPGVHVWAHYSGDVKDETFMDCCMILKNE